MEAHDYNGEHQPDLKFLVQQYEAMLQDGGISFLEIDSFLRLTDYYEEDNRFNLAFEVLTYAIQQHPFSASLYIRKAQILCEQESYQQAFEALDQAIIYEPSDLDIYLTKADIYMRLFKQDKAIKVIDQALQYANAEDFADLYILKSTIYETKNDYTNALLYLKKALFKDPNNEIALSRLWGIYDANKDYADAINFHLKFIDRAPYSYWAWYNLGLAYMYMGLVEKASEAFDYAIVINEQFEPAYLCYIDCLIVLNDLKTAKRYLGEYLNIFEVDAEIWYRMGQCFEQQSNYAKAIHYYTKALEFSTLDGLIFHRIGNCYIEEEKWHLAEQAFLQAYDANKQNANFCLSLADTYDALEIPDKAYQFYHKALVINPEDIDIWIHYIEFLIDEEAHDTALEVLEEAKKYVEDVLIDYALAAVLLDAGKRQEGFLVLGQALLDHYDLHQHIFHIAPQLEKDAELATFILRYKEEL